MKLTIFSILASIILLAICKNSMASSTQVMFVTNTEPNNRLYSCNYKLTICNYYNTDINLDTITANPQFELWGEEMRPSILLVSKTANTTAKILSCEFFQDQLNMDCEKINLNLPTASSYSTLVTRFATPFSSLFVSNSSVIYHCIPPMCQHYQVPQIKDLFFNDKDNMLYMLNSSGTILSYEYDSPTLVRKDVDTLQNFGMTAIAFNNSRSTLYVATKNGIEYLPVSDNGTVIGTHVLVTNLGGSAKYLATNQDDLYALTDNEIIHINLSTKSTRVFHIAGTVPVSNIKSLTAYEDPNTHG